MKVNCTNLDMGRDQFEDVERAREIILVNGHLGAHPIDRSALCREALYRLVDELKAGTFEPPESPRPGEDRIVEVGKWPRGA